MVMPVTGEEGAFCSSSSFWRLGHHLLLLLRFGVSGALLCLLRLVSRGFKERINKLVNWLFEGRTMWPKNSTPIRGIVVIGGNYSLGDPLNSPSPEASTLLSYLSFRLSYLLTG